MTRPDYYRCGAGSMLIAWGTARADEVDLDAYLQASEMGQPLYERHGFKIVKLLQFDLSRFGGDGGFRHMVSLSCIQSVFAHLPSYAAAFPNALQHDMSLIVGLEFAASNYLLKFF